MSIERFAVMFSGCGSYQSGARSTAGGTLSRVELAGVLAGLSDIEQNYFYAFFGDEKCLSNLGEAMIGQALSLARREEWRGDLELIAGIIRAMVQAALDENLDGRCHSCNGTGVSRRARMCSACSGSGVARLPDARLAAIIGIDRSNYSRCWKRRYDRIFVMIQDVECSVKMKIRKSEGRDVVLLA
jgi:hypothetical protein